MRHDELSDTYASASVTEAQPAGVTSPVGASTIVVAALILTSSIALGLSAVITARVLGPSERGVFAIDITAAALLSLVGTVGVGLGGRRLLAEPQRAGVTLRDYDTVKLALVVIQAPAAWIVAVGVLPALGAGRSHTERIAFVAATSAMVAASMSRDGLYGVGSSRLAALFTALGGLMQLSTVIVISVAGVGSVSRYLWAFVAGAALECLLATTAAWHRSGGSPAIGRAAQRRFVQAGPPALALVLAETALLRGDRLVLASVESTRQVGLYAVAATAAGFLSTGSAAAGQVLFRPVASATATDAMVRRVRRQTLGVTALAAGALIIVAPVIVRTLFGPEFEGSSPSLRVLAVAIVPFASYQIDSYLLVANGQATVAARGATAGVLAIAVGVLVTVPTFGILGAAWTALIVYLGLAAYLRSVLRV